jgi:hypothetical protein
MSTKTPLLRLNIIPFDQDPWDDDSNENTSILDGVVGQFMAVANMQGIWKNSTAYLVSQQVVDSVDGSIWLCNVPHTSIAAPSLFSDDRTANPTFWTNSGASAGSYAASAAASATAAANSAAQQGQNVGRNLIHNGLFRVQQRGTGPWTTTSTFTADRWMMFIGTGGGSRSVSAIALGDASRSAIGDEDANFCLDYGFTGGAAAGDIDMLIQRIENVRRLGNKTVTISFWANASGGTPKIGINALQAFGSGGSPSTAVAALATGIATPALSATWRKYTATINMPSTAGKTLGTTPNTDYTAINLYLSSGSGSNALAGNIGVQSGTVNIWGVQVEVGSVATPLEKLDPRIEIANCQRFYCSSFNAGVAPTQNAGLNTGEVTFPAAVAGVSQQRSPTYSFPVTMRAVPAMTTFNPSAANAQMRDETASVDGSGTVVAPSDHGFRFAGAGNASTAVGNLLALHFTATADL